MNRDITSLFLKYKNAHIQNIVAGAGSQLNVHIREYQEINKHLFLMVSKFNKIYTNPGTKTQNGHLLLRALGFYCKGDDWWEVGPVSSQQMVLGAGIRRRGPGELAVVLVGDVEKEQEAPHMANGGTGTHTKSSEQRGEAREDEAGCRGGVVRHSAPFYREER
jgi:hypothetical protein